MKFLKIINGDKSENGNTSLAIQLAWAHIEVGNGNNVALAGDESSC